MKGTRARLITLLESDPPDVDGAIDVLRHLDERSLAPGAANMRLAMLEAAGRLENGEVKDTVASFLRNMADGQIEDLDDIDIDFDVPETIPGSPFDGLGFARPGRDSLPMPGPDKALLEAMDMRDQLSARRIAGDVINEDDIQAFENKLVDLGKALLPLLRIHLDESDLS